MFFLIWLPGFVFIGFVAVVCYRNKLQLLALAKQIHNGYVFTDTERDEVADKLETIASQDDRIGDEGIRALIDYAAELKPDWIAGVNSGGRVLSITVAKQIAFDLSRCFYVRYDTDTEELTVVRDPVVPLYGTLLVIDDISKSGNTLAAVKDYFIDHNGSQGMMLTRARFAVLVLDDTPDDPHTDFVPDWVRYKTLDGQNFRFAWTPISEKIKGECKRKKASRERHERSATRTAEVTSLPSAEETRLATDPDYAASELRKYLATA
jgi:hypothetical protein